jgi:hypothetical protein
MTDSGSVQWTSRRSPGFKGFSALRVFSAGNGHLSPVRSSLVVAMGGTMRKRRCAVNGRRFGCGNGKRLSDQIFVTKEPDALPRFDLGYVLAKFDQSLGLHQ